MADLTEKWEAGELEEGAYYILLATDEIYPDSYDQYGYFEQFDNLVEKVLAPVPSYEEMQALKEENASLKGLLKELHNQLSKLLVDGAEPQDEEIIKFLTKIEEMMK